MDIKDQTKTLQKNITGTHYNEGGSPDKTFKPSPDDLLRYIFIKQWNSDQSLHLKEIKIN